MARGLLMVYTDAPPGANVVQGFKVSWAQAGVFKVSVYRYRSATVGDVETLFSEAVDDNAVIAFLATFGVSLTNTFKAVLRGRG